MSYQYQDRGAPYGIPNSDMAAPSGRRPLPANYAPSERQRRGPPPPMRPGHQGGPPPPGVRYPPRPPPQHHAQPPVMEPVESLYDGSAYGGADNDQAEQWPLPSKPFAQSGRSNSPGGSPRKPPPQRPQRPDHQESILDPPRQAPRIAPANRAYHQGLPPPSHHGIGRWTGDGYSRSPEPPRFPPPNPPRPPPPPPPQSAHAPIPEYQMPQPLQQAVCGQRNQRPPLGPPPSSRRGPPSYFPQIAPVHPIAEETDSMRGSIRNASTVFGDPSHSSYASSNAIPIGIPGYYVQDRGSARSLPYHRRPSEEINEEPSFEPTFESGRESGRDDRESPSPEPAALIRQASLGKKSKPTLTTVKSGERMRKDGTALGQGVSPGRQREIVHQKETAPAFDKEAELSRPSVSDSGSDEVAGGEKSTYAEKALEAGGVTALGATAAAAALYPRNNHSQENLGTRSASSDLLSSGTGLLDASSSDSESEIRKVPSKERLGAAVGKEQQQRSKPRSPLAPRDSRVESSIRGGLERGGALTPSEPEPLNISKGDRKRPPKLNIDAVRDAEARGSMTSLPDLIRRATKLASNLDRGKTASRLGMNFFVDGSDSDQEKWRGLGTNDNRRSGSLSDILASFPPPGSRDGLGSRDGVGRGRGSFGNWSSGLRHSRLRSDSDAGATRKKKRRCCGLPLWLFLLLLLLVFLLVAAAVVVPVVLLVIIPGQDGGNGDTAAALASCQKKLTCQNGGTNILSHDGFCQCLCVNGYTGTTCSSRSQAGCTTIAVDSTQHATVGEEIPRLLRDAGGNFSLSLDKQTLLGLFSSADMSCNSENALVTFSNVERRRDTGLDADDTTRTLEVRQATRTSGASGVATSNGIVYQSGTPSSSSGNQSPSPSSSSGSNSTSSTTLDFARVAVLYIFQDSGEVTSAVTAQENLQSYFSTGKTAKGQSVQPQNVSLGSGYSCDLKSLQLSLSNGTTIGG